MDVSVDCVIFSYTNELEVLLIKRNQEPNKNKYCLIGGFVKEKENLLNAAKRELIEETGIKNIDLLQIGAFGKTNRDPRKRIVSVGYLGFVDSNTELKSSGEGKIG